MNKRTRIKRKRTRCPTITLLRSDKPSQDKRKSFVGQESKARGSEIRKTIFSSCGCALTKSETSKGFGGRLLRSGND